MKFSFATPTTSMVATFNDLLYTIYEDNVPPTREELGSIILLNALNGSDYDWVRKSLVAQFSNPKTVPTMRDIIETINFAGSDRHNLHDSANIVKTEKASSLKKTCCSNCQSTRHAFKNCWAKGGSAEGKGPDWWKALQERKLKSKAMPDDKANIASILETGLDDDDLHASVDPTEFLNDEKRFVDGYESYTALYSPTNNPSIPAMSATAQDYNLWCANSGSTVHVSPVQSDFLELENCTRKICGLSGNVSVDGVGTVTLQCSSRKSLSLHHCLYAPNANMHLISTGKLANEGMHTLTGSSCLTWIPRAILSPMVLASLTLFTISLCSSPLLLLPTSLAPCLILKHGTNGSVMLTTSQS